MPVQTSDGDDDGAPAEPACLLLITLLCGALTAHLKRTHTSDTGNDRQCTQTEKVGWCGPYASAETDRPGRDHSDSKVARLNSPSLQPPCSAAWPLLACRPGTAKGGRQARGSPRSNPACGGKGSWLCTQCRSRLARMSSSLVGQALALVLLPTYMHACVGMGCCLAACAHAALAKRLALATTPVSCTLSPARLHARQPSWSSVLVHHQAVRCKWPAKAASRKPRASLFQPRPVLDGSHATTAEGRRTDTNTADSSLLDPLPLPGAGWAGLGAARHLTLQGYNTTLLDAAANPGEGMPVGTHSCPRAYVLACTCWRARRAIPVLVHHPLHWEGFRPERAYVLASMHAVQFLLIVHHHSPGREGASRGRNSSPIPPTPPNRRAERWLPDKEGPGM